MTRKDKLNAELARLKQEFTEMVATYVETHPTLTLTEIGEVLGIDSAEVSRCAKEHGIRRKRGNGSPAVKQGENNEKQK